MGRLSYIPAKAISFLKHDRVGLVETTVSVYLLVSVLKFAIWFESLREIDRGKAQVQTVQVFGSVAGMRKPQSGAVARCKNEK